jgi:pSer/pThr/pTyr-binding forkhead associated (FHA) protein
VIETSPSFEPGRSFELGVSPVTIGRSGENAIALPQDEYASSQHARLEPLRDGVWLVDLGSRNGTYVNGRQVNGREQLHDGDVVHIGETDLRVEWSRA